MTKILKKLLAAVITISMVISTAVIPVNAEDIAGWTSHFSGGAVGSVTIDNNVFYNGNASLKLVNNSPKSANVYMRAITKVSLEKGKEYTISARVKALQGTTIALSMGWTKMYYITPFGGTYEWTNYEFTYIAPETKSTEFFILVEGVARSVWLDDVKVIDVETGENLVTNPGFEGTENNSNSNGNGNENLEEIYNRIHSSETFSEEDMVKVRGGFKYMPVYAAENIEVDGDGDDWASYPALSMPTLPTQYNVYINDAAPRDVFAECKFAQDAENFYMIIEVTDDTFKYMSGENEYWRGDSIQLTLSSTDENYGSELGFAHNPTTGEGEIYGSGFDAETKAKMTLKTSQYGKKTVYEAKIPWTTKFEGRPEQLYFDFLINDNDGAGRRYCAELAPGISEGKTNAQFPMLEILSSQKDWYAWVQVPRNTVTVDNTVYECYIVNSGEEKTFTIENLTDGTVEEVVVPAQSGVRREIVKVYEGAGEEQVEVRFTTGEESYISSAKTSISIKPPSEEEARAVIDKMKAQAEELSTLLSKCEKKGISTDYERINYTIINRFPRYIEEDIKNNDLMRLEYTAEATDELYEEAKTALESYLSGEKKPKTVPRYVTSNITMDGKSTYATVEIDEKKEERPVFFVGYGHFATAKNDIPNFNAFGVNATQMEIGVSQVMRKDDKWKVESFSGPDMKVDTTDETATDGDRSLKVIYNSTMGANRYVTIYQNIDVEPGKTYVLSGKVKADNATNFWISPNGFNATQYLSGTYDWKDFSYEYTMPEGVTRTNVRILVQDKAKSIYFDNISFKEKGTDKEILLDGSFEDLFTSDEYIFDSEQGYFTNTLRQLEIAEENNISVSFIVGPHYFLNDFIEKYDMAASNGFLKYNVNAPKAREMVEQFIRELVPHIAEYDSVDNICISNEPQFWVSQEQMEFFYIDRWHEYLKNVYNNDITVLNAAYKSAFSAFEEIDLQADETNPAKHYDQKMFNDMVFGEWHKFMADIIHELAPDIPLHTKIMGYATSNANRKNLLNNGTGYHEYYDYLDMNGCDYWNYIDDDFGPLVKEMWYDYMTSIKDAPVINSEDHIIPDRNENFTPEVADYVSQDIYQGAIHGRASSVIWVWDRSPDSKSDFRGSILYRPDAISKVGKASLDLNRLSYEITALQNELPEVGIIYSDADMLNNRNAMHAAYEVYEAAMFNGKRVKFITDYNTAAIDGCRLVVVPDTIYVKADMLQKLKSYIQNGGRVLIMGENRLTMDEHTFEHDRETVEYILNNSTVMPYEGTPYEMLSMTGEEFRSYFRSILKEEGLYYVSVVDAETGIPMDKVEYNLGVYGDKVIINLANFGEECNVKVLAGKTPITEAVELRSEETVGESITIGKYESVTLSVEPGSVFLDIFGHWAENDIAELAREKVISGISESRYNPNGTTTRAEFLALLMRTTEFNNTVYKGEIPDVIGNEWYSRNVAQALNAGIIEEGQHFRPNENITREEMCQLLVKCKEKMGVELTMNSTLLFIDNNEITDKEAIQKAVSAGLMVGRDDGRFDPTGNATRAEAAAVIKRFIG